MSESFWLGRRALVTGAGGFIGSWLAKALADAGSEVVCPLLPEADNSPIDLLGLRSRVEAVEADLVDSATAERLVSGYAVDSVFHLAAQPIVGEAGRFPVPTFQSNIQGTWNVLEACRNSDRVERIVVASSDKAYGEQTELPYREEQPLSGLHPYDASKACADILAQCYARTFDLPVAVTRAANVYGGADLNFSRIVPGTIRSILRDERPIIRSDGTPLRDYVYVDDTVRGYLLLAERLPNPALHGEAFNLGANSPLSVTDVVEQILRAAGDPPLPPRILANGETDHEIKRQYLDSSKAKAVLGWHPETTLDQGLQHTLAWYRENLARP
ncbi:MAG: GDP-mannose 4,6-dehydratase [Actinobacteria bacterium]|nr:GDP-mannose 4,6-dehydratase [Actinomycetota bacterium]